MAAFKLTLTKTDTGDVLVDEEIDCLIGGACAKDENTSQMAYSDCDPLHLAAANAALHRVVKKLEIDVPILAPLTEAMITESERREKEREQE